VKILSSSCLRDNNLSSVIALECTKIVVISALIRGRMCPLARVEFVLYDFETMQLDTRLRCSSMHRWISPPAHQFSSLRVDEAQMGLSYRRISDARHSFIDDVPRARIFPASRSSIYKTITKVDREKSDD